MVIPFGFGVGDFLAISKLIFKIGLELKKNPESASDYQHLLIELESLDRALKQLYCIKPAYHELRRLEGIRALATACQRPLEEFLAKIEEFEEHLGSWSVKRNPLSRFSRRLQWSIKYKEDVEELRAKLAPNIATITILLMTQTTDTLSKAESDRFKIARQLRRKLSFQRTSLAGLKQTALNIATTQARLEVGLTNLAAGGAAQDQEFSSLQSKADELLKDSIAHELHLNGQNAILEDIRGSGIAIDAQTRETHAVATAIHQNVTNTQATASSVLGLVLDIMSAVTAGISKIQDITELIAQMVTLTTRFTFEMREMMGRLLQAFWDIQTQLARLERFLPRQIDLPVVRFRDAFNEMRSLPYDLCRQWQTFQGLVTVVFMNRQGLHRVKMGQYFVTNARLGQRLNRAFWSNAIEPGDELSMTMVLDDIEGEDGFCPFKSCGTSTKHVEMRRGGKSCPNCFRFAVLSQKKRLKIQGLESLHASSAPDVDVESLSDYSGNREATEREEAAAHAPELEGPASEDIERYYSIQVVQPLLSSAYDDDRSSKQIPSQNTLDEDLKVKMIAGDNKGRSDVMDERYYVRTDAQRFFTPGRVFAFLWHESAGNAGTELSEGREYSTKFGQSIYSTIRRMVVIKGKIGHCTCVPIATYGNRGTLKPGLSDTDIKAHAVIYMIGTSSAAAPGEKIAKKPIAVRPANEGQKLHPMSRINFEKIYTIEHNVKVMNVGKVADEWMHDLSLYFFNTHFGA